MNKKEFSKNIRAEHLVGLRPPGTSIRFPAELGFFCPRCKNKPMSEDMVDERLEWSEYNGFLWCSICNKDYPSCFCHNDLDLAITIYLDCIKDAMIKK